jgi:DNA mismatch repair protein MutL
VSRVAILPDALADQIAAGEVVERPASVVKELLENALDAGAAAVTLEVEGGGVGRILVTDDGAGMGREDARLAILRHATSKIREADDLEAIATFGFRGEALPSIASVSRFVMRTRRREDVEGTEVRIDGGAEVTVRPAGGAAGTTVEVRDLFFNVPARRKFLKSTGTESAHVAEAARRVALSHPGLHLLLRRDGRTALDVSAAQTRAERASQVFAKHRLGGVEGARDGMRVEAFLTPPEDARSGASGLHLFVNRRPVRDRALARAVAFAYGSVLPPGRYPVGVVYLDLDPRKVDVNVHPQKAEVRFAEGRAVLDALTRLLAAGLGTTAWGRRPAVASPPRPALPPLSSPAVQGSDPWGLASPPIEAAPPAQEGLGLSPPAPRPYPQDLLGSEGFFSSLRVLGQVRRMFIVCEGPDGLHVLDQHAADERVRYDRLRRRVREGTVEVQGLLVPVRVELAESEIALLSEAGDEVLGLGLDVAVLGPTTAAVHGHPAMLRRADPERLLRDVVDQLSCRGERAFGDALDMALATMACHGSIRGGDPLSPEECRALLRNLDEVEDFGGHCPHGRPVVYGVRFDELERKLGR